MNLVLIGSILLSIIQYSVSLKYTLPTIKFIKKIDNFEIPVIEPEKTEPKDTYAALFLTGGNNIIPADIYNNFLNTLASHRFSINLIPGNFNSYDKLFTQLKKEYKGLIILQHSSSTILSINLSKMESSIKSLVFIDPVDNRIFFEEYRKLNNKIDLFSVKKILFLKAAKSYHWRLNPPTVPFIPFLSLKPSSFNLNRKCKVTTIEAINFGHTDILDKSFSNFMHNSRISVGTNDRNSTLLMSYHKWLSNVIHYFCYHNDIESCSNKFKDEDIQFSIKNE